MKALLFIVLTFFSGFSVINTCLAQMPTWAWAKQATPLTVDVSGIATDTNGNIYTLGKAPYGISFGNLPPLTGYMFLVKHTPQGNPVWAIQANCFPAAIATDAAGNSYITGSFTDTMELNGQVLVCRGLKDIFTAKLDSAGNVIWLRQAGSIGYSPLMPVMPPVKEDEGISIAFDDAGNCYIGGVVVVSDTSAAFFDSITVYPVVPDLFPHYISVVAKYNSAGQIQWVRSINEGWGVTKSVAVSSQGVCYVAGSFGQTLSYGNISVTSNGLSDVCYAAYDTAGTLLWAKSFGGSGSESEDAMAVNEQGEIFVTGSFKDTMQFGAFVLTRPTGTSGLFVAKLDSNGIPVWASQATGPGLSGESQIAADANGNSYVSCLFSDSVYIGNSGFYSPGAGYDVLVSKWSATGEPLWTVAAQGSGNDFPKGIALNPDYTACYVSGTFTNNLTFGNTTLQTGQNTSFFLAKLANIVSSAPEIFSGKGLAVYPNPADRSFSVALENAANGENGDFFLYNITGQLVRQVNFTGSSKIEVNRVNLPSGLYIYKLQTESEIVGTGKIILN